MDEKMRDQFVQSWAAAVQSHDLPRMLSHFGETMKFSSPAIYKPATERPHIDQLIGHVAELIEDFNYTSIYPTPDGAVMIFEGHCGETRLEGLMCSRFTRTAKSRN